MIILPRISATLAPHYAAVTVFNSTILHHCQIICNTLHNCKFISISGVSMKCNYTSANLITIFAIYFLFFAVIINYYMDFIQLKNNY